MDYKLTISRPIYNEERKKISWEIDEQSCPVLSETLESEQCKEFFKN